MFSREKGLFSGGFDISGFWIPYSDLMAALLGIFALLLVVTIYEMGEPIKEVQSLLDERRQVARLLENEFANIEGVEITDTGSVRLTDDVLFNTNVDSLNAEGRARLLMIMPKYLSVVTTRDTFKSQLSRILVEGHADPSFTGTDSLAGYLYNLNLSQRRAASVVTFLMSSDALAEHRSFMKTYFMASGRSSTDLVINSKSGKPDFDRSRRIQIDFLMKDTELVGELMEGMILRKNPNP